MADTYTIVYSNNCLNQVVYSKIKQSKQIKLKIKIFSHSWLLNTARWLRNNFLNSVQVLHKWDFLINSGKNIYLLWVWSDTETLFSKKWTRPHVYLVSNYYLDLQVYKVNHTRITVSRSQSTISETHSTLTRSSRPEVFCKKGVLIFSGSYFCLTLVFFSSRAYYDIMIS